MSLNTSASGDQGVLGAAAELLQDVVLRVSPRPFSAVYTRGELLVVVELELGGNGGLATFRHLLHSVGQADLLLLRAGARRLFLIP